MLSFEVADRHFFKALTSNPAPTAAAGTDYKKTTPYQ